MNDILDWIAVAAFLGFVALYVAWLVWVNWKAKQRRVEEPMEAETDKAPPPTIINGVEVDLTLMTGIRVDVGDFFAGVVIPVANCPGHFLALCGPDLITDGKEYDDRLAAVTHVVKMHQVGQKTSAFAKALFGELRQAPEAAAGTEVTTP